MHSVSENDRTLSLNFIFSIASESDISSFPKTDKFNLKIQITVIVLKLNIQIHFHPFREPVGDLRFNLRGLIYLYSHGLNFPFF